MRLDLPSIRAEHPRNAALLDFLRAQGCPPSGPDDYALGEWQLHTHPDLLDRLAELARRAPLHAAYGVPVLAREGVAAAAALGTSVLLVRLPAAPTDLEAGTPAPFLAGHGWQAVDAWQSGLPCAEGARRLSGAVRRALAGARDLAS
ncbi:MULTISPECIES: hypothetical protein [unclassified Streptomyces]|uniref:hypothetical protein n=1 Tax=unclassified Streptomyces TaxID=2593676 RepID=UPI0022592F9E|nr:MULTISPECIES: hypothetical protein [unclassified Streptomyces]MCX4993160.1 hypothetical protein [Streptomyces sp. NBC_00568]MCX5009402.1 hypothetical protein [Streptomyces sp. NBC_00638]